MGGGGQSTNTVQSATPWAGVQPGLSALYSGASQMFGPQGTGGPQAYTGQMVEPFNAYQISGLNSLNSVSNGLQPLQSSAQTMGANMSSGNTIGQEGQSNILSGLGLSGTLNQMGGGATAAQGVLQQLANNGGLAGQGFGNVLSGLGLSGTLNQIGAGATQGQQGLSNIINGSNAGIQSLTGMLGQNYLNVNNNPALQNAMTAANQNTTRAFQTATMPQLASEFSAAGRFGSGAQSQGISDATNNLATQISGTNASMASNAYTNLLNNQLQAAQAIPQLQGTAASNLASSMLGGAQAGVNAQNAAAQGLGTLEGTAASNLAGTQLSAATAGVNAQNTAAANANQMYGSTAQMLPGLAGLNAQQAEQQIGLGSMIQGQSQSQLSGQIQQYLAQQQQPLTNLNSYAQILAGGNPFGSTSTSGGTSSTANPFTTAMGGLLGAGALSTTPLGAGLMGGLLGGGASALSFAMPAAAAGGSALMPSLLGGMGMLAF